MKSWCWLSLCWLTMALLGQLMTPVSAASRNWPSYEMPIEGHPYVPAVKTIQYLLRARSYKAVADGHFGPQTQDAVQKFQKGHGLQRGANNDGVVESLTWEHLIVRIGKGSRGDAVRALQSLLHDLGSPQSTPTKVDGVFSEQTRTTIRKFQRAYHLTVDGVVGPATWHKLIIVAKEAESLHLGVLNDGNNNRE